jgi:Na+:H+ antiporter, NhaA family
MSYRLKQGQRLRRLGKLLFVRPIQTFINREVTSGQLLLFATLFAMVWAQPAYISDYHAFWYSPAFTWLPYPMDTPHFWINDGLMVLFFLVVGLEIKQEITQGELAGWQKAAMPLFAAMGGVIAPALIYLGIAGRLAPAGWAIPTATDIAFALAALAIVGSRVPLSVRIFLTALAIVDDLLAIAIIAVFYTDNLHWGWLGPCLVVLGLLGGLNRLKVAALWPYMALGGVLWWCMHQLGIHTTLAGVLLALLIPTSHPSGVSPADTLAHRLHPITSFGVVPLFALANAGISLQPEVIKSQFADPITLGILAGLVIGKPLGITISCWLVHQCKWAKLPADMTWGQLLGLGMLGGIGFTMALFVTSLGLNDPANQETARLGILVGSLVSAGMGIGMLWLCSLRRKL